MTEMMEQQSTAFVVCVLCGVIIGFLISCFHVLKKVIKMHGVWIGIFDLTFWLALCATVILVMFYYNSGEIRLYIFLGFFSGAGLYFATINWAVSRLLNYILCGIKIGLRKVISRAKMLVDIICSRR